MVQGTVDFDNRIIRKEPPARVIIRTSGSLSFITGKISLWHNLGRMFMKSPQLSLILLPLISYIYNKREIKILFSLNLINLMKEGGVMSFVHYDEIAEICCGMAEMEEVLSKVEPVLEPLKLMKDSYEDPNRWWEEVAKEILKEKERDRELLHV